MQVLLFQAVGMPDGSIVIPPPFTAEGQPSLPGEGAADLEVELIDAGGTPLLRHRVAFATPCAMPASASLSAHTPPRLAQALIAQHDKARTLRVRQWGLVLHERTVTEPPAIDVAWPSADALDGGEVELSWSCADAAVSGLWQFSNNGRTWTSLSLPQPAGSCKVDLGSLPGGRNCRLRLLSSDGVQTHRIDSAAFVLKPRGWVALLLAPADGTSVPGDAEVELLGQGFELEKRVAEFDKLSWSSSIDGELGTGHRRRVRLSPGRHQITLSVFGRAAPPVSIAVG